jgi:hypothetical protein
VEAVVTAIDIDPAKLRTVIDDLTDALIGAVALAGYAVHGTAAEAAALDAAVRRATAALKGLQLGICAGARGRR